MGEPPVPQRVETPDVEIDRLRSELQAERTRTQLLESDLTVARCQLQAAVVAERNAIHRGLSKAVDRILSSRSVSAREKLVMTTVIHEIMSSVVLGRYSAEKR